ncbi:hypothetical protein DFQ28_000010 [Apophysomyces sp. BC1034]|nr:hypothetical protein DFQ30_005479 [Apophysomyces sp. BC1015]KAG0182770.1 hypothetical protein DFQ29_002182 [Apophysomyces sp. BC1021]KAG0194911.1 hypothetical protein DFQ28_000010 [Apophysomyces sp. BC1034]
MSTTFATPDSSYLFPQLQIDSDLDYSKPTLPSPPLVANNNVDLDDFFVEKKDVVIMDNDSWRHVVSKMKQQMYNTTSVALPLPTKYMKSDSNGRKGCNPTGHGLRIYNDELFLIEDIFSFRQLRSENLLHRMLHCYDMSDKSSVMRLSKGVFIQQKWQPQTPQSSPTLSTIGESSVFSTDSLAPIDTFQFNDPSFCQQADPWSPCIMNTFVPYSYTFGIRYTNPYGNASDVLVRGNVPLWIQSLFLSTCANNMPIRPNETRTGLLPFAPEVPVTFRAMADCYGEEPYPELTIMYERFAMELSEPEMYLSEHDPDNSGRTWAERKRQVLEQMLYWEIPDGLAEALTNLGTIWAANQGFLM